MQPLWTVAEAVAATGGRPESLSDGPLHSVSIDSREIDHDDRRAVRLELAPAAQRHMADWRDRRARMVGSRPP